MGGWGSLVRTVVGSVVAKFVQDPVWIPREALQRTAFLASTFASRTVAAAREVVSFPAQVAAIVNKNGASMLERVRVRSRAFVRNWQQHIDESKRVYGNGLRAGWAKVQSMISFSKRE